MKKLYSLLALSLAAASLTATAAPLSNPVFPSRAAEGTDLTDLPLVNELPDGVQSEFYSRDDIYFSLDFYGQLTFNADYGRASEVAIDEDGTVYFGNPFGGFPTGSYLTGHLDGDKITVSFPQKIYSETYEDWNADPTGQTMRTDYAFAYKMTYTDDGTTSRLEIDTENPVMTFTYADGRISQDDQAFIGMVALAERETEGGEMGQYLEWSGSADSQMVYSKVTAPKVALPEGAKLGNWIFTSGDERRLVQAGFVGDDFYIQGMLTSAPDFLFKGSYADGKVTFEADQLMGLSERDDHFAWFTGASYTVATNDEGEEYNVYTPLAKMAVDCDADRKLLVSDADQAFVVSTIPGRIYYIEAYDDPELEKQDDSTPMTPADPEIYSYTYYDEMEFGGIVYHIPEESTDGRLLDTSRLYYEFYIDDEPLTLYPDEYWDLEEPMTMIPYAYEDGSIYFWYTYHEAMIFARGFQKIGVQAIYLGDDDSETRSNIVYHDTNSVDTVAGEAAEAEYFDLNGMRVSSDARGLLIRRAVMTDGSVSVTKIIRK